MNKFFLKTILFLLPFGLGLLGYFIAFDHNWSSAVYSSIRLYSINLDTTDMNIYLEIARWTAPLVTCAIFITVLSSLNAYLKGWMISTFQPDSYAIYGDSQFAHALNENMSSSAFMGDSKRITHVNNHVIFGNTDAENIQLYTKLRASQSDSKIFMELSYIKRDIFIDEKLFVFSMNELIARAYWRNSPLHMKDFKLHGTEYYDHRVLDQSIKVGLIGKKGLMHELLAFGLLVNVYSPNQKIEYYLFGDDGSYRLLHTELAELNGDTIEFHDNQWFENVEVLQDMDRIIICEDDMNEVKVLSDMLSLNLCLSTRLDLLTNADKSIINLFRDGRINAFKISDYVCSKDIIINGSMNQEAKETHESYRKNELEKDPTSKVPLWNELDSFKRYSNIMKAEHEPVMKWLIATGKTVEWLAEVEHIRWSRYHYINNWRFGEKRHDRSRKHHSLKPYRELNDEEKLKDQRIILDLIDKMKKGEQH